MDSGECFLVDWVCTLLSCHLGRVVLVTMVVILYKELTMGIYRGKEKLEGKVLQLCFYIITIDYICRLR